MSKDISIYEPIDKEKVKTQIFEIRGYRVILGSDISVYFDVTTGNLNKAMKRNIKRFPENFCFQLSKNEYENLIFQNGISSQINTYGGIKRFGYLQRYNRKSTCKFFSFVDLNRE